MCCWRPPCHQDELHCSRLNPGRGNRTIWPGWNSRWNDCNPNLGHARPTGFSGPLSPFGAGPLVPVHPNPIVSQIGRNLLRPGVLHGRQRATSPCQCYPQTFAASFSTPAWTFQWDHQSVDVMVWNWLLWCPVVYGIDASTLRWSWSPDLSECHPVSHSGVQLYQHMQYSGSSYGPQGKGLRESYSTVTRPFLLNKV